MDAQTFILASGLTDTELAERFGCHRTYWSHLRNGNKALGKPTAFRIWKQTGTKLAPLAAAQDDDIEAMARMEGWAA